MKKMKVFFDLVPAMLMWMMLSIFLWGFVFNFLTDADPAEKLVIFIDAPLAQETRLAASLEEITAAPVNMVQVRSFNYAMMSSVEIERADLYIVGASQAEDYKSWFAPLPKALLSVGEILVIDGQSCGVKIYDAASGNGAAAAHIGYAAPGQVVEDYYLFVGVRSLHVQEHEGAVDDQAVTCALQLLSTP